MQKMTSIAEWLFCITDSQRNWGFGLCYLYHVNNVVVLYYNLDHKNDN